MPDITMCMTKDCPIKEDCYRYKAKPEPFYQSYADFTDVCKDTNYSELYPIGDKK